MLAISTLLVSCTSNTGNTGDTASTASPSHEVTVIDGEPTPTASEATPSPTATASASQSYTEYNITLTVEPESGTVNGVEKVSYRNITETALDTLYFNIPINAFSRRNSYTPYFESFESKIFAEGKDYATFNIANVTINGDAVDDYALEETVLKIELPTALQPDERTEISLTFESYIPKINHRTGRNDNAMWFGNFLPTLAVYDSDGWHTDPYYAAGDPFYSRIANYTLKVTTPENYIVAGTGEESKLDSDGKRVTTITAKLVRDFAFAISDSYNVATIKAASGTYVNMYYYSDLNVSEFLDTAAYALDYYSETIGTYPYTSFDIFETGQFSNNGMEYPQLTFIDSNYLKTTDSHKTLVHEIGHQWFYNIVGNNQVTAAWLDEGLTSYIQMGAYMNDDEIATSIRASYNTLKNYLPQTEHSTLDNDLSVYTSWKEYYNSQYLRGKLMFYALNQKMGDEAFNQFLKTYYANYSYRIATPDDLIQTAEDVYGKSLQSFFEVWISGDELPELD